MKQTHQQANTSITQIDELFHFAQANDEDKNIRMGFLRASPGRVEGRKSKPKEVSGFFRQVPVILIRFVSLGFSFRTTRSKNFAAEFDLIRFDHQFIKFAPIDSVTFTKFEGNLDRRLA